MHSIKRYKKVAIVAPLVCLLGTGLTFVNKPIHAAAAETPTSNTVSQVNSVKGYLLKNGVTTPVYENTKLNSDQSGPVSPTFPTLSTDPLAGVPKEGTTVTESGNMGDILYFEGGCPTPSGKPGKFYLKKRINHNNDIEYGTYDPETYELYPSNPEEEMYGPNQAIFKHLQDGLNASYSKAFDGQTKVKRETKYELIDSAITDNAAGYTYSHAVTSGVSTADLFSFSSTLGWKMSAKIGGGIIPAEITAEMSGSLTTNYGHTITVTSSDTRTQQFSLGKVDNPSYKYKQYATAAYQLKSTYTTIPGTGLNQVMKEHPLLKGLANKVYKYNEDQMYFGVTPGSHLSA